MYKNLTLFFIIYLSLINNAYAYLDPGTGSTILAAIAAALAAGTATTRHYWGKVKNLYIKIFQKKKINKD